MDARKASQMAKTVRAEGTNGSGVVRQDRPPTSGPLEPMDVPVLPEVRQRRRLRRRLVSGSVLAVLAVLLLGLTQLKPLGPKVDKLSVWMDTVKRGEMLRQVRGSGVLVPEDIRWIPSLNAGRVERILVLPGARVQADTVLVELSNADVEQAAFDAEWQLKGAEADLANLRVQLASQKLIQEASVASAEANYAAARLDLEVNEELSKSKLVPALTVKQSKARCEELSKLLEVERARLKLHPESAQAQLAVQEARGAQLRAQLELRRRQVRALKVCAGMEGVLQRLGDTANSLQVGQQVGPGALLARVANPAKLKAAIHIAETQAKDIQLGQPAEIDTRNGAVPGHVTRIDPAVENNTVTIDVALDAVLPKGARPDLSVEGTIELERLTNVLYVGRPVSVQTETNLALFKLLEGGRSAVRVPVKLGSCSVSTVEILQGLQLGDKVILSDMSEWEKWERVRLD
jgi:HlyD family secretion protein